MNDNIFDNSRRNTESISCVPEICFTNFSGFSNTVDFGPQYLSNHRLQNNQLNTKKTERFKYNSLSYILEKGAVFL